MQKWERRKYTCCNLHKHLFLSKSFPIYRNVNYRTLPSKTLYVNSFMGQTFILWWFYESGDLNDIFLAGLITVQNKNAHRSKKNIYIYDFFVKPRFMSKCPSLNISCLLIPRPEQSWIKKHSQSILIANHGKVKHLLLCLNYETF